MDSFRRQNPQAALMALEAAAASARGGFACMFSSSDEYETALISERRAQGRYDRQSRRWPAVMFLGCALMLAGTVLLLHAGPGQYVPVKETVRSFREVLDGKHDDLPEQAFYMVGTIDQAREKAAQLAKQD